MSETVQLQAADGHTLSAYRAGPDGAMRSLVVLQEIFGVNQHMRDVCARFAAEGYRVIAPALFDRVRPGIEFGYTPADVAQGLAARAEIAESAVLLDIEAAAASLGQSPRGIVGYCWGGTLAWWGATRMTGFSAAVGWYGGGIAATRTEAPHCPVQLHFGERDNGIPIADVDAIRTAQPGVAVFTYPGAAHGFGCDARPSFSAEATQLAQKRTLAFFAQHL